MFYNVYAMHRNEDVFGPRTEEFVPERWQDLRPGWGYLPFNGGARACIGREFRFLLWPVMILVTQLANVS